MHSPLISPRLDVDDLREKANGRWPGIFDALCIAVGTGKHGPCPVCGGRDRFRCDNKNGSGSWFCNVCDPHAGDGFGLLMNVRRCAFPEALRIVAGVLGITPASHKPCPRPSSKPIPVERVKLAFQLNMAALDRQRRAKRIFEAAKSLDVSGLSEAELDRALAHVAQAYADVERAELFEGVADDLRSRDFTERKAREQHPCAA